MDKVMKNKRSLKLVTSLFRLRKKFIKISLLVILPDQVWCYIKRFLSCSKNYTCKFMQASSWHDKLFHFYFFFWIRKVRKGRGKITKVWVSRERKEKYAYSASSRLWLYLETHLEKSLQALWNKCSRFYLKMVPQYHIDAFIYSQVNHVLLLLL